DGSSPTLVYDSGGPSIEQPDFSPNGRRIAFVQFSMSGAEDIYTVAATGGKAKNMTKNPDNTYDGSPVFSPDGTEIAFSRAVLASDNSITSTITTIPAAGGSAKALVTAASGSTIREIDWAAK